MQDEVQEIKALLGDATIHKTKPEKRLYDSLIFALAEAGYNPHRIYKGLRATGKKIGLSTVTRRYREWKQAQVKANSTDAA